MLRPFALRKKHNAGEVDEGEFSDVSLNFTGMGVLTDEGVVWESLFYKLPLPKTLKSLGYHHCPVNSRALAHSITGSHPAPSGLTGGITRHSQAFPGPALLKRERAAPESP